MLDSDVSPAKTLTFDVATAAIKGGREYQEDSLIANFPMGQGAGFAIIADGIGGHVAGQLASAIVMTEVFTHLKLQESQLITGVLSVPFALREAAEQANRKIAAHIKKNPDTKGMGSTLLAPVIRGARLSWISIGDSPLLLLRNGALRQLNKDHSMSPQIDMLVKTGAMTAEVGHAHPDRNTLLSVINGDDIPQIDCPTSPILLKDGDILIAASDGLQFLSNTMIANTLMKARAGRSVDIANAFLSAIAQHNHPDQDNTTFVIVKIAEEAKEDEVMDLDSMPVLAQAEGEDPTAAPKPAVVAEPVKDERKAYWYRGQKYFKD